MPTSAVHRQDAGIRALIASRHRYAVVPEFDRRGPRAYTVGLTEEGLPELIVFGLHDVVAQNLLNAAVERVRASGPLTAGEHLDGLVEGGYPIVVVDVADSAEFLSAANRFYRLIDPVPAQQLVFPDVDGRLPWQDGSLLSDMPVLGPVPGI